MSCPFLPLDSAMYTVGAAGCSGGGFWCEGALVKRFWYKNQVTGSGGAQQRSWAENKRRYER